MTNWFDFVLVGLAALAAGAVNALAGGGTLITFPTLTAVGIPAIAANITNTVALCPGYLGATFAQSGDLQGQKSRLWLLLPAGAIGGIIGGILLLNTGERVFRALVPFLILLASGLLAVQDPGRTWLARHSKHSTPRKASENWAAFPVGLAAVYGGYFGAGIGIMMLAMLGLLGGRDIHRMNGVKVVLGAVINAVASLVFLGANAVDLPAAGVMALGAIVGGLGGAGLARRADPRKVRWLIVAIGVSLTLGLAWKRWS